MPFTLSHPAAVLPLHALLGGRAVLSALVVGSLAPDFPYYLGLGWPRATTHSLASLLWWAVPAGWLGHLVFQYGLRRPGVFLLPRALRERLDPAPHVGGALAVTGCLVVGAATHVAWDAFTHGGERLATAWPLLRHEWLVVGGYALWSYSVLQYGSTLFGAAVLVAACARRLARTEPVTSEPDPAHLEPLRRRSRAVAAGLPPCVGLAMGLGLAAPGATLPEVAWFAIHVAVAGLSTLVLVVAAVGVALRRATAA